MATARYSMAPMDTTDSALLNEEDFADLLRTTSANLYRQRQELEKAVNDIARRLASENNKRGCIEDLRKEWTTIADNHRKLSRDARNNAIACALSLEMFNQIFVEMEDSFTSPNEKRQSLDEFMKILNKKQDEAQAICDRFERLGSDVEAFSEKISTSVFSTLWRWIKRMCSLIMNVIRGSMKCYWRVLQFSVHNTAQAIEQLRLVISAMRDGTRLKETPLFQKAYSRIVPENTNKAVKIAENMQDDAHVVQASIGQYERAWGLVSDACLKMATKAELAGALLTNRDQLASIFRAIKCLFSALLSFLRGYDRPNYTPTKTTDSMHGKHA